MSLQERRVYNSVPYEKKRMHSLPHYEGPQAVEANERKRDIQMLRPSISAQIRTRSRQKNYSDIFKNNVVSNAIEYSSVS